MVGEHPGELEFGVGFLIPKEGDEIVVTGGEEVHGKFWVTVGAVEPGDLVVVFVGIEDGAGRFGGLEGWGYVEAFGEERLIEEVAAFIDVEIAKGDEVLVVGVDIGCPVAEPAGDTF